jgi:HPt (histidine-containing phosphotransfer) domain-containing protein
MTGGSASNYTEVLALFCKDAADRLEHLKDAPDEAGLPVFVSHVHSLKSALASIGAAEQAKEAALLEDAGRSGDTALICERFPDFRAELERLTEHIRAALPQESARATERGAGGADKKTLLLLKNALDTEDVNTADELLEDLAKTARDAETLRIFTEISERILMYEFAEAARLADDLINKEARNYG